MVNTLVGSIKEKKEFHALSDAFVKEKLQQYVSTHKQEEKKVIASEYNKKSAIYKKIVKEVRAVLRDAYGLFQTTSIEKRQTLFEDYKKARGRKEVFSLLDQLLASHQSTKERKDHFNTFYKQLFAITGKPEHILDLGCGYNPMSYAWLGCEPRYEANDIAEADIALLNNFFAFEEVDAEASTLDLLNDKARKTCLQTTKADMIFILKLIDTIEGQRRNITKTIIEEILNNKNVKWVVASFPLKSVGGKQMRQGGKENWFSRFISEKGCTWELLEIGDEELYCIKTAL